MIWANLKVLKDISEIKLFAGMRIDTLSSTIILAASLLMVGNSSEVLGQSTGGLKIYDVPNAGLRFSYPASWGILEVDGECTETTDCSVTSTAMGEKINDFMFRVAVIPSENWEMKGLCNCDTLIEFVQYMYKEAERAYTDGFEFVNDSRVLVGKKYPAWQIEYLARLNPGDELQTHTEILTENNNTFYKFTYTPFTASSPTYQLPEFRKIIDSVEFLPVNRTVPKIPSFFNSSFSNHSIGTGSPLDSTEAGFSLDSLDTVKILSHNSFTDSIGYLHIVGELQNNAPRGVEFVKVTGTFYDANNQVVGTDFTYTNPSDVGPGQKAPFELILTSASIPVNQIDHYSLVANHN